VIEKCDSAFRNMHRPIVQSETATAAIITSDIRGREVPVGKPLDRDTFEYMYYSATSERTFLIVGRVSSYNINRYKGRLFIADERRPIPFELASSARDADTVGLVTNSLRLNALDRSQGNIECEAFKVFSRSGRLKSLLVVKVTRQK